VRQGVDPLVVDQAPRLGRPFVVQSGLTESFADGSATYFMFTGDSNVSFGGLPLPLDPLRFGLRWCGQLPVSILHIAITSEVQNARWLGEVVFAIPSDRNLVGASFYPAVCR
jgi:hypothetical protein